MSTSGSETSSAIADAIEMLEGDWHRKGRLEASDISRIAAKRNLDLEELHAVLEGLREKGILDRIRGKDAGVTAWSRFPLRLLSLQQIQRFADAMAAAELVRRQESISGAPFSVGFLVGDGASPNRVRRPEQQHDSRHDPDDPNSSI